jgi:hypothetical protein
MGYSVIRQSITQGDPTTPVIIQRRKTVRAFACGADG